jgi:predicted CXXCH cytochrome family protein
MRLVGVVALVAIVVALFGCSGTTSTPPDNGGGGTVTVAYVGSQVCSQCHRSQYADWTTTSHSRAVATLVDHGRETTESCLECHALGLGQPGGFIDMTTTQDRGNVGCESCHGPGGEHIKNPGQVRLLKSLSSDVCGRCHTGPRYGTYDEWKTSKHANALASVRTSPQGGPECLTCHSADAILAQNQNVVVGLQAETVVAQDSVTCVVCHFPHGGPNAHQLRLPVSQVCLPCHTDQGTKPGGTPHSAQAEVLLGVGGYRAPEVENVMGPMDHGTAFGKRCAQCHVFKITPDQPSVTNPVIYGHTFEPNVPTSCTYCHAASKALALKSAAQAEIGGKVTALKRYFAPGDPLYINRDSLSIDKQVRLDVAKLNVQLVDVDGSRGVHNLDYARALLQTAEDIFTTL